MYNIEIHISRLPIKIQWPWGTCKYYANILIFCMWYLGVKRKLCGGRDLKLSRKYFSHYAVGHPNVCIHVCIYVIFKLGFGGYGWNCLSWGGKLPGGIVRGSVGEELSRG